MLLPSFSANKSNVLIVLRFCLGSLHPPKKTAGGVGGGGTTWMGVGKMLSGLGNVFFLDFWDLNKRI